MDYHSGLKKILKDMGFQDMKTEYIKIKISTEHSVSGALGIPEGQLRDSGVILAHGAINDMNHPLIIFVHKVLAEKGYLTLRFNFLYRELGKERPDDQQSLIECYRRAIQFLMEYEEYKIKHLFIGGKSLGGRIASYVAGETPSISGLIFLGYPLQIPGKMERLSDEYLYKINQPMLFISGTKDPLAPKDLLEELISRLSPKAKLHLIPKGDHSINVPKILGRSQEEVYQEISQVIYEWLHELTT